MTSPDANFTPDRQLIADVTNALGAVVTTVSNHGFTTGDWIRIFVPEVYGMSINFEATQIAVTSLTEFNTDIDTSYRLAFVAPTAPPAFTPAQAIPISGETDNIGSL